MKKETKNINARYDIDTGKWTIRNNGEVLNEGQGIENFRTAVNTLEQTETKKIVVKFTER